MPEQGLEAWRRVDPADRARQFMPFAALRGYYDLVRERERAAEPRREMSEERAAELDRRLAQLERGSVARVTYYDGSAYATLTGAISCIDGTLRVLGIVKERISFDDIWSIELTW